MYFYKVTELVSGILGKKHFFVGRKSNLFLKNLLKNFTVQVNHFLPRKNYILIQKCLQLLHPGKILSRRIRKKNDQNKRKPQGNSCHKINEKNTEIRHPALLHTFFHTKYRRHKNKWSQLPHFLHMKNKF
jgi:hypothetical protein